ncbi:hypothetical protein QQS21_000372 [Conoideocrella luteorostrata]|uniref:Secretory phospholipase A2 n=1 Tax=Conoideocrella luteorostrata TaxID=1105319 RepID=A0AAJ0FZC5_9HYPO|nr:hypothetical protein QQS21_000372 [Conoideocrella luteorostrata]
MFFSIIIHLLTSLFTTVVTPKPAPASPSAQPVAVPQNQTVHPVHVPPQRYNGTLKSLIPVTDKLLFNVALYEFEDSRNRHMPSVLIWITDGCTNSLDNPFQFPFLPACHRHDFGYNNYRPQNRFTETNKLKIDDKFLEDLYLQCEHEWAKIVCTSLADVYYKGVRAFGGLDAIPDGTPSKRGDELKEYEESILIYEAEVKKAQEAGLLPLLDRSH